MRACVSLCLCVPVSVCFGHGGTKTVQLLDAQFCE